MKELMEARPRRLDVDSRARLLQINREARRLRIAGMATVAIFFGGFGTWAAVAPISSAAVAPGVVVVQSNRKTVQHLEGGIVKEILVKEGDTVRQGQVLVRLEDTQARASAQLLEDRYWTGRALEARLVAERDGADTIRFPDDLVAAAEHEPAAAAMMATQEHLFQSRREALQGQIDILRKQIQEQEEQIAGLDAQQKAEAKQLAYFKDELASTQALYDKGLGIKSRLMALKRAGASLEGSRAGHLADIARTRQAIAEAELKILDLKNQRMNEVLKDLHDTQADLSEIGERLQAARDVVERTEIRAPRDGVVVGLQVHTVGGVIPPGGSVLDIVPQDEKLIIEAQVRTEDIESVHSGLRAEVRLVGSNPRDTPMLDGRVTYVSADRLTDPQTHMPYYKANVEVDPQSLKRAGDLKLYPGMPAEVMIVTGKRTPLEYFLHPVTYGLERALRER
ncbi:MAG: HlyD family type I secretion periplasmic adaptor subunit [Rhodospirillaceae bacterium]|nr:HlyD family type I secretion periplasmic adaptor subunit [Rhodospirillaceae bacterium]